MCLVASLAAWAASRAGLSALLEIARTPLASRAPEPMAARMARMLEPPCEARNPILIGFVNSMIGLDIDLKRQAVEGRLDALRQALGQGPVIQVDVHIGQDGPLGPDPGDPLEGHVEMGVGRVRR